MAMASKGHFLTQIPHPIQSSSEIYASLLFGATSRKIAMLYLSKNTIGVHTYALFSELDHWTRSFTFLATFLRFTLVFFDNCHSG